MLKQSLNILIKLDFTVKSFINFFLIILSFSLQAQSNEDPFIGTWIEEKSNIKIIIYKENEGYYAKVEDNYSESPVIVIYDGRRLTRRKITDASFVNIYNIRGKYEEIRTNLRLNSKKDKLTIKAVDFWRNLKITLKKVS